MDQEWEHNRQVELSVDLIANWTRILPCFIVSLLLIAFLFWLHAPFSPLIIVAILMFFFAFVCSRLIVWLRLWGAYIERRLEEIEAKIDGRDTEFYASKSPIAMKNGLHEKLDNLVDKVEISQREASEEIKNQAWNLGYAMGMDPMEIETIIQYYGSKSISAIERTLHRAKPLKPVLPD